MVIVPPPRPSITGGTVNGTVYGFGIFFSEILDAVLARTVRSSGSATAAAPNADTFSTSRRDKAKVPMTFPIPLLYFRCRRHSSIAALSWSRWWGVVQPPTSGDVPRQGVLSGSTGTAGARMDSTSKGRFTQRERCGPLPR